jgi:hypothetical protein
MATRIIGDWDQPRGSSLVPLVYGAYAKVPFKIRNVPAGSVVAKVTWTAKQTLDDASPALQKQVTTALVNSVGQITQANGGTDIEGFLVFSITEITSSLPSPLLQDTWVILADDNRRQVAAGDVTFVKPVTTFGSGASAGSPLPPISGGTALVIRAADIANRETGTLPSGHTFTLGSDPTQIDSNDPYMDTTSSPPQFVTFGDDYVTVNGGGGAGQAATLNTILASVVGVSAVWAGNIEAGDLSGNKVLFACDRADGTAIWLVLTGGQLELKRFRKSVGGGLLGADVARMNAPITIGHRRLGFIYLAGQVDANSSYRLYVDGVSVGFSYSSEGASSFADPTNTDATAQLHLGYSPIVSSMQPPKRHLLAVVAPGVWSAGDVTQNNNWITDQGW